MKTVTVLENVRVAIGAGGAISYPDAERLRRFDMAHASSTGTSIFDWTRRDAMTARGYVGVIQIPGLAVEILPKTDDSAGVEGTQRNLLYMLHQSGWLRARERSFAALERQTMPLIDAFVLVFADSLLDALREGLDRAYIERAENLAVVRGRLVMSEHVRRNAFHQERLFVRYDDFSEDTKLNRLLKATCRLLVRRVRSFGVARRLKEIVLRFDAVSDVAPRRGDLRIDLTRQNKRFQPHLDFCRFVWGGQSPTLALGAEASFSLLFSMPRLFEAFIAAVLRGHLGELGLPVRRIQAQHQGPYLVEGEGRKRYFRLRPDVVGFGDEASAVFVLDTKWKRLQPEAPIKSVAETDAYQLFAYARQYRASTSVLLYPAVHGAESRTFTFAGTDQLMRVGFVNLNRDLRRERKKLVEELGVLLRA